MTWVSETAAAVVTLLSPYMPFLKEAGTLAGKKVVETIAEKGAGAAWNKAQQVWQRITGHFGDAPELQRAASLVAAKPDDSTYQTVFAKALSTHLEKHPDFSAELVQLMGGEASIQEILAEKGSRIKGIRQEMEGYGRQTIEASDESTIEGVRQTKKR